MRGWTRGAGKRQGWDGVITGVFGFTDALSLSRRGDTAARLQASTVQTVLAAQFFGNTQAAAGWEERSGRRPAPEDGRRRTGLGNNGRQRPQTTATTGGSSPGRAAVPGDDDVCRRSRTTAAREEIRRGKGGAERNQWRRRRLKQREEVEEENQRGRRPCSQKTPGYWLGGLFLHAGCNGRCRPRKPNGRKTA
ncbi:hypothetical protein BRADI_5g14518v3 [Brachypodium distachyon]|uniref:Uncharacterized protein n=1 Tax=Brachypodium distachyon TaxID=15368 RepID=A0A2K2CH80_BRADI|nr:hypothetical protein BRADI_5g14518v3 [Brachypodium distachyon]